MAQLSQRTANIWGSHHMGLKNGVMPPHLLDLKQEAGQQVSGVRRTWNTAGRAKIDNRHDQMSSLTGSDRWFSPRRFSSPAQRQAHLGPKRNQILPQFAKTRWITVSNFSRTTQSRFRYRYPDCLLHLGQVPGALTAETHYAVGSDPNGKQKCFRSRETPVSQPAG